MSMFDAPQSSSFFGGGNEGPLSRLLRMMMSGGDPEASGHARASQAMEPITGPYLHDVATGQMAARNMPQNLYGPNRSFAQNAMDPQAIDQAMNIALSVGPGAIKAYHGSPHNFDKFDSSKIGEGEGAQAYGHGLYFAENEGVARSYKSAGQPSYLGADRIKAAQDLLAEAGGDRLAAMNIANQRMLDTKKYSEGKLWTDVINNFDDLVTKSPGHMYEVNINAEPGGFLNWDKPLSEQGSSIRDFIANRERQRKDALANVDPSKFTDYQAFERAHGAALDQAAKLRVNPDWTGAQLYESSKLVPGEYRDPAAASAALRDAGIPGIRYLDQGSRGGGEGTSNYVVFNDNLIEILRKYGLAGLTGGAGAAAATSPYNQE